MQEIINGNIVAKSQIKKVANFEKVSINEFRKSIVDVFGQAYKDNYELITEMYNKIKLPKRATIGSAGYDFVSPFFINLYPGETLKIPTGIRVRIDPGWVLQIYPRSGLGFKYRAQLDNTVGIIDSDYYNSDNEGHIFIKLTNDSREDRTINISSGEKFVQGIFHEYGITYNDNIDESKIRNGGFGSTDK